MDLLKKRCLKPMDSETIMAEDLRGPVALKGTEEQAYALYRKGRVLHDQGREVEAAGLYRQAVSLNPFLAEAYNDLGAIAQKQGQLHEAVVFYRTALSLNPGFVEACYNLGNTYKELKEWEEAEQYCRMALERDPQLVEALFTLGVIHHQRKRTADAVACWLKVVELKPEHLQAHLNLASVYYTEKQWEEAEAFYKKALLLNPKLALPWLGLGKIKEDQGDRESAEALYHQARVYEPTFPETYVRLGALALEQGALDRAIEYFEQALRLSPDRAEYHNHLGNAYNKNKDWKKAEVCFERAIRLNPDDYSAYNNLGLVLHRQGRLEESLKMYEKAVSLNPDKPELQVNLGNLYKELGRISEAIDQFRKVIQHHPDFPFAHWNLSLVLLSIGCFEEGWQEYEYRLKLHETICRKDLPFPLWNGEAIQGKRLLLHQEQGIGDTIQFVRYIPMIQEKGGKVFLQCQPELKALLSSLEGCEGVLSFEDELPACDYHCPLLSLPRIFKTDLPHIPARIPYLFADPTKVERWRRRLLREGEGKRIGLVWAGRPEHAHDHNRSLSLHRFSPLFRVAGIAWFSLQKGEAVRQLDDFAEKDRIQDYTGELADFSDTAALIENLDLVITVDTSVAHLAGALGRPVWTLIHFSSDWRWLLDREDSPWYPTMRLFRQTRYGDWDGVIERVAEELDRIALDGRAGGDR